MITKRTGLVIDAYFSGSKIRWILENVPGPRKRPANGELLFGNIDTWLIWNLTSGAVHVTDSTNASRTMLMNLETGDGTTNCCASSTCRGHAAEHRAVVSAGWA